MPDGPSTPHDARTLEILQQTGALIRDSHFVYTTWLHGRDYINKDAIYPNPLLTYEIAEMIAQANADLDFSVVISPEKGGIVLSNNVAHALSIRRKQLVSGVFVEKNDDGFHFGRGYDGVVQGKRALLVEDTVNTGDSVEKLLRAAKQGGVEVAGIAAICNRGGLTERDFNVPFRFLTQFQMETWSEQDCLACLSGVPVDITHGKGAEYERRKAMLNS